MTDSPNPRTLCVYAKEWRAWCLWCEPRGIDPVHCAVDDLALCFRELVATGLSYSLVGRRRAAIGHYHRQFGAPSVANDYAMRAVMRDLHRAARPPRGKLPLSRADLTRIVADCEADARVLHGLRDRAIFAVGWWCGLNRSPLEALRVADLSNGRLRRLSDEARRWTLEWLQAAKIVTGPLFRPIITRRLSGRGRPATELVENDPLTGHGIRDVIDARCVAIGKAKGMFSVSSLRAGRITHEIRRGTDVRDIMGLARVHTLDTVVRRTGPKREARTA